MTCEICKKEKFCYERKVVDEIFILCEDCDWSTEDIETAEKIGSAFSDLLKNSKKDYGPLV